MNLRRGRDCLPCSHANSRSGHAVTAQVGWPRLLLLLLVCQAMCGACTRPSPLTVGDPAPPLKTGSWIQGEPVGEFAGDKVYLIEFWATWCGPCIQSIPHLDDLAREFKDSGLVVIGQNVQEPNPDDAKRFVADMGDKMTYRVVLDDTRTAKGGEMVEAWLKAYGDTSLPTAFLVGKDGRIAWIGHPMELDANVVKKVVAGTYDFHQAATIKSIVNHIKANDWNAGDAELEKAARILMPEPAELAELRWMLSFGRVAERMCRHLEAKELDAAEVAFLQLPGKPGISEESDQDVERTMERCRIMLLLHRGEWDAAGAAAEQYARMKSVADDATKLVDVAQLMLCFRNMNGRARDVAGAVLARANDLKGGKDVVILSLLARAAFLNGDHARAVEITRNAMGIAAADDSESVETLREVLESYEKGVLSETLLIYR